MVDLSFAYSVQRRVQRATYNMQYSLQHTIQHATCNMQCTTRHAMQVLQVRIMDLLQLQDVVLASDRYVDLQKQAFYAKSAELRTHTPPTWVVHPPALRARGIAAWTNRTFGVPRSWRKRTT